MTQTPIQAESLERTTRSAAARSKPQPKLKLKLSEKAAAQAPGMSFLGPYDRELDSDEEELAFEEQFILRLPQGDDCDRLRKMVAEREVSNDVWFKFKGASCHIVPCDYRLTRNSKIQGVLSFTSETTPTHPNSSIFHV